MNNQSTFTENLLKLQDILSKINNGITNIKTEKYRILGQLTQHLTEFDLSEIPVDVELDEIGDLQINVKYTIHCDGFYRKTLHENNNYKWEPIASDEFFDALLKYIENEYKSNNIKDQLKESLKEFIKKL